jgi:hypothetical protein
MRRRAASDAVRQAIEPPPGPATVPVLPIAAGAGLVALWLLRPRKKPTKREQLVTLAAGTAASIKSQRKQAERAGRKAMKDLRKEARRTARSANKQLQRQSTRARQQLEAALDRAQQGSNGAAGTASSIWDRTDIDDRVAEGVGAARERLEAAIERASIPERAAAVRERVEQVIDESEVPERIEAVRKAARKRSKRWFGRWHL